MADEGLIDSGRGRAFHKMGGVPKVTVLRVVSTDGDSVFGIPESWHGDEPPPKLRIIEAKSPKNGKGRMAALGIGDRILARTEERGAGHVAHPMKRLEAADETVLGVVSARAQQRRRARGQS